MYQGVVAPAQQHEVGREVSPLDPVDYVGASHQRRSVTIDYATRSSATNATRSPVRTIRVALHTSRTCDSPLMMMRVILASQASRRAACGATAPPAQFARPTGPALEGFQRNKRAHGATPYAERDSQSGRSDPGRWQRVVTTYEDYEAYQRRPTARFRSSCWSDSPTRKPDF